MTDKAPLIFETHLGMLRPANAVAETALREIKGRVRVEIKGGASNERRRSLYWRVAELVVPILNDLYGMTLDEDDLHDISRKKLKLYDEIQLPSGEIHKRLKSTKASAMNEADRAEYTDKAFHVWSAWTGVDVATLTREAA